MPAMARPRFTATRWQMLTYLVGVALFSISFLVFLNSQISFVITNRIGQTTRVGDAVGTLGFADELVALLACPAWGMLSDRVGVRAVTVCGFVIVSVSLASLVMSTNVYPQLLIGRLAFSVGGAATATMVTAILPTMTIPRAGTAVASVASRPGSRHTDGANITPSISSELTITPARYQSNDQLPGEEDASKEPSTEATTSQFAGLVGMFTGLGALLALTIFLPLPGRFEAGGATPSQAVIESFDIVAAVGLVIAAACFFGLRGLPGEEYKGWRALVSRQKRDDKDTVVTNRESQRVSEALPSYLRLLSNAVKLGFRDMNIGLGYVGGFVARASSVGISLFVPLFVNAYFLNSGRCYPDPDNPTLPNIPNDPSLKKGCPEAYVLAAKLTGTSQLVALLCAPLFGYLSGRYHRYNLPLMLAAFAGIAGYTTFGLIKTPDPAESDGSAGIFFIVALLGISQIGAIVCSLGLLGRGIQSDNVESVSSSGIAPLANGRGPSEEAEPDGRRPVNPNGAPITNRRDSLSRNVAVTSGLAHETSPLLPSHSRRTGIDQTSSRASLKGSVAGVYSLGGGAGILLLTKIGGVLFDRADVGSPFWMMAGFNAVLFVATAGCSVREYTQHKREGWQQVAAEEETETNGTIHGYSHG